MLRRGYLRVYMALLAMVFGLDALRCSLAKDNKDNTMDNRTAVCAPWCLDSMLCSVAWTTERR